MMRLDQIAEINPPRKVRKGDIVPFVEMAALPQCSRDIGVDSVLRREAKGAGAHFRNGDTLLARITPCLENGKTAQVRCLDDFVVGEGSTEFIVLCGKNPAENDFIYYLCRTPAFREYAISRMEGTSGRQRVSWQSIAAYEFASPPPNERKAAAAILSGLDDRITLLRETNATLEAIAQALFKSWFVDFDPVRAKQEGRAPEGMDEATAALFPDRFEESEPVPQGWRFDSLGSWLSVLETGRRPKGGVGAIEEGIPSIGAESITRIGQFDYSKTKYVSEEFFEKMKSGALESHDVLLYKDGGKPGVFLPRVSMFGDGFPFETCGINEHVFRVRLNPPFNQTFLYLWLWSDSIMHELKHRGGKAAIPGINQADVKEQRLLVPSDKVLSRFDELSAPLVTKIFSNAKRIQALSSVRDALLPRLISGQLRLPQAEVLTA
ncbi:restriction endonuclease subunit S [Chitinimonas lacunae]|uniref:Restriction endonuclease subunit S n=1 Tax=Chitinimonas lacunae TaxID=1963018 RepID=A0ABV8MY97_9NEIS